MKYVFTKAHLAQIIYKYTGEIGLRLVRKSKRMKKPACHIRVVALNPNGTVSEI